MREEDMPYREIKSDEFLISREALDEAYSALAGAKGALGDIANISAGMEALKTARGNVGGLYEGHDPQFVVGASSEPITQDVPIPSEAKLGLATNAQLEQELRVRHEMGHTAPDYRTVD